jgi:predicted ATP-dependent endonuclease of OLD family
VRIIKFRIENYKSFWATEDIYLTPGFNVIVGQNNVGKTALVEALSPSMANNPHRSLHQQGIQNAASKLDISYSLKTEEFFRLVQNISNPLYIPVPSNQMDVSVWSQRFIESVRHEVVIDASFSSGELQRAIISDYGDYWTQGQHTLPVMVFAIETEKMLPILSQNAITNVSSSGVRNAVMDAALNLRPRTYHFRAERLNVTTGAS